MEHEISEINGRGVEFKPVPSRPRDTGADKLLETQYPETVAINTMNPPINPCAQKTIFDVFC